MKTSPGLHMHVFSFFGAAVSRFRSPDFWGDLAALVPLFDAATTRGNMVSWGNAADFRATSLSRQTVSCFLCSLFVKIDLDE